MQSFSKGGYREFAEVLSQVRGHRNHKQAVYTFSNLKVVLEFETCLQSSGLNPSVLKLITSWPIILCLQGTTTHGFALLILDRKEKSCYHPVWWLRPGEVSLNTGRRRDKSCTSGALRPRIGLNVRTVPPVRNIPG